jgi:hypothetical protein
MPNGVFPVPAFKTVPRRQAAPGSPLRVRTRVQRNRLDEQIAGGADTTATAELTLRAAQLRTHAERQRIANALVEAVGEARRGDPVTVRTKPHRAQVRACADELLGLAARLRDDLPVDVRGGAMAARLVTDRHGPLRSTRGGDLRQAVEAARTTMDTRREIAEDLRAAA